MILLLCLFGPELANLHPNDQTAWKIYLTAKEAANAILCGSIAYLLRGRIRMVALAVAVIFATQAIDEAMGGNVIADHAYEYVVEAAFIALTWYLTRAYNDQG